MNKEEIQIGDLVTDKPRGCAFEPIDSIGLVVAPHEWLGWKVYWFKYAEIAWWYECYLTKLDIPNE